MRWLKRLRNKYFVYVHTPGGPRDHRWDRRPRPLGTPQCESQLCLFGREWIQCSKRKGHRGIHRHNDSWGWEEGDHTV